LLGAGTWNLESWRGNRTVGKVLLSVGILAYAVMLGSFAISPPSSRTGVAGDDCYIDWDGRSNPTVCE
jgi:hypothetical protein